MSKTNGAKIEITKPDQEPVEKQQRKVIKVLKTLMVDEVVLYTKLRNYHWNVTGPSFFSLHAAFEDQFTQIAELIDEIAETIRQHGSYVPGTMEDFIRKARLSEEPGVYPIAPTMLANLVADHDSISQCLQDDIQMIEQTSGDVVAVDLMTNILKQHQKMAWMLRSCLQDA